MTKLPQSELILYETEDGKTRVQVKTDGETVWLTQDQMSELFDTDRTSITKHVKIFSILTN